MAPDAANEEGLDGGSTNAGGGQSHPPDRLAALSQAVGHARFVVLVPVLAVLLVAFSLFLLGTVHAVTGAWQAWVGVLQGRAEVPEVSVTVLKTVTVMLEAVVFFLVGVGLYSLFVAPLNLAVALGIETLNDLEERVIGVVVVVLTVTFLEHFIQWREPREILQFGGALALTVGALVLFQFSSRRATVAQKAHKPDTKDRSRRDMFQRDTEQPDLKPEEKTHGRPGADREAPP